MRIAVSKYSSCQKRRQPASEQANKKTRCSASYPDWTRNIALYVALGVKANIGPSCLDTKFWKVAQRSLQITAVEPYRNFPVRALGI
jgi:hypothetical protein